MKLILFWKPLLWLALICYALFIPASDLPSGSFFNIPHFDKMVHFVLFFVLCIFLFRPLKKLNANNYLWAPLISASLSALLELIQHQISATRTSDIYDFISNTTGVLVSILFFRVFVENRRWENLL